MKTVITILMLLGVCMASTITSEFRAEKIAAADVATLKAARQKLDAAQQELEAVESGIKSKFGQTAPSSITTAGCVQGRTEVELRGEWALVTQTTWNVCQPDTVGTVTLSAPTSIKPGRTP